MTSTHDSSPLVFLTGRRQGPHELNLAADIPEQAEHGPQSRLVDREAGDDRPVSSGVHLDLAEPAAQLLAAHARQSTADLQAVGQQHGSGSLSRTGASVGAVGGVAPHPGREDHPGWAGTTDQMRPSSRPRSTASTRDVAPSFRYRFFV